MLPDGRVVPLDDALGPVFALVAYGCDPRSVLARGLLERFTQLGGHVVQVVPGHTRDGSSPPERVCDHTGALQQWFSAHAMQVALVRPDRYLFGGGTLALLPDLLQQLFTLLPVPSHIPV
jgi:3-(3-hydroxy-phenyl)propionate hydroxylase